LKRIFLSISNLHLDRVYIQVEIQELMRLIDNEELELERRII
jgi:hypothetical protein